MTLLEIIFVNIVGVICRESIARHGESHEKEKCPVVLRLLWTKSRPGAGVLVPTVRETCYAWINDGNLFSPHREGLPISDSARRGEITKERQT